MRAPTIQPINQRRKAHQRMPPFKNMLSILRPSILIKDTSVKVYFLCVGIFNVSKPLFDT
jgi:hypothetical protein